MTESFTDKEVGSSTWTAEDLLHAVISDCRQPLIEIRGFCEILLNSENFSLDVKKQRELIEYILNRTIKIEEVLKFSVKELNILISNDNKNNLEG